MDASAYNISFDSNRLSILYADYVKRRDALDDENAKLRELIDLKQTCWKYVGWCDECPYNGVDDERDDCNCTVRQKVRSLARELGIEMD